MTTRMCPNCVTVPMARRRIEKTKIDGCPTCHGIFFDPGEGALFGLNERELWAAPVVRVSERRCPDHSLTMDIREIYGEHGQVHFETARCCKGFFLEVDEPVRLSNRAAAPAPTKRKLDPADDFRRAVLADRIVSLRRQLRDLEAELHELEG